MKKPRMLSLQIATAVLITAWGCENEGDLESEIGGRPVPGVAFPMTDCAALPPISVTLRRDATFDFTNDLAVEGVARATDVALGPDSTIFILDDRAHQVVVLDPQGNELRRWGTEGAGPGELREPIGIEVGDSLVYILEASGRLHMFSTSGAFVRTVTIRFGPTSFALIGPGRFVLTATITNLRQNQDHVAIADTTGRVHVIESVASTALGRRPLLGSTFNRTNVSVSPDGRFAVWYEIDNSVDVYRDSLRVATIRGCMPDEVIESYTKQRSANVGEARGIRGVVSQQSRRVIGGVGFDEGGDIFVANFRSVRGAGRISRYDSLGVARAVYDFPVEGFDFQNAIWSLDGTAIVTWSYLGGWVRRWIWEGRQ